MRRPTHITIDERLFWALEHLDQHPTIPIPHKHVVRHLVARSTHHVLAVPREPNRIPRSPINEVLESVRGLEEVGGRVEAEHAKRPVGR